MGGDCLEDVSFARTELENVRGFDVVSADTLRSRLLSWSEASRNVYSGNFNRIQNRVNTAPGYDITDHVLRTVTQLGEKGVTVQEVCSDAAGYQKTLMQRLERKRIRFYIRARKSSAMEKHIGSLAQWTAFGNTPQQWAETTWNGYRLIVQREVKRSGQTSVFSGTAYTYRAIITNDNRSKSDGDFIIRHYNKRGGIERNFDTLRN